MVHGGLALTLLDSAMACAVQTQLPPGSGYTTLEVKVNLVRAITTRTGKLRAIGKVLHSGSRIGTAEGRLEDLSGKLYAHGTTTCIVTTREASKPVGTDSSCSTLRSSRPEPASNTVASATWATTSDRRNVAKV